MTSAEAREGRREAGVLLHPTALPGPHGVGDLGSAAHTFVDRIAEARQTVWQVLPLGPAGLGDSPYSSPSSFAGNTALISLDRLATDGLLVVDDLDRGPGDEPATDPALALEFKSDRLRRAHARFRDRPPHAIARAFERFADAPERASGLDDWALYAAIKATLGGRAWTAWPAALRGRDRDALAHARAEHADEIRYHRFAQFVFERQWSALRRHAAARGVRMVGDLPIYVAHDSADVWASRQWFRLDVDGQPTHVAGVPPDYFSDTGQLWGNPLYDWDGLRGDGFRWWVDRVAAALALVDVLRLDHFRGFEAFWEIPAGEPTAREGRWVPGPGAPLFDALRHAFGGLPFLAEDLGVITDEVRALRDDLGLPGMKVLQFGFEEGSEHHPDRITANDVVYTGTHDNDTTLGWWSGLDDAGRARVCETLGKHPPRMPDDLVDAALGSAAHLAIVPAQDWLRLGSEARFNRPGTIDGNWHWRLAPDALDDAWVERVANRTAASGRGP